MTIDSSQDPIGVTGKFDHHEDLHDPHAVEAQGLASSLPGVRSAPLWPPGPSQQPAVPLSAHAYSSVVDAPGKPRLWGGEDFIAHAKAIAEEDWFWDGILPGAGLVMIAGQPFSGKSVLMALLAAAARDGRKLAGRDVVESKVLYVKLEHVDSAFGELLEQARQGAGAAAFDNLFILKELALHDDESLAYAAACADQVGAHVIIIDSLRRASTLDENSSQEAAEAMRRLQSLTNDGKRLVIVLHHLAKGTVVTPRGSGDFQASVDTFITIHKSDDMVKLNVVHHSGEDTELCYRLEFHNGMALATAVSSTSGASATAGQPELEDLILQLCGQQEHTRSGLRAAVRSARAGSGISNETIDARADALSHQGRLQNVGNAHKHRWRTIPTVAAPAGGMLGTASP